jgi:hypothetical protein
MNQDEKQELTELSAEMISLDDISLTDLEARLELALGHLALSFEGCTCNCPMLATCVGYGGCPGS